MGREFRKDWEEGRWHWEDWGYAFRARGLWWRWWGNPLDHWWYWLSDQEIWQPAGFGEDVWVTSAADGSALWPIPFMLTRSPMNGWESRSQQNSHFFPY